MKIYESNDRGDKFICGMGDDWSDPRPLAQVIQFRGKHHEVRLKLCGATAEKLAMVARLLQDDVDKLKLTGIWREHAPLRRRALEPELRGHEEARDPATRALLRVTHALMTAAHTLLAISKTRPDDE